MSTIHIVVRAIQFILFLLSLGLVYYIYIEKNTTKQRLLLLASISSILNMYGYLEEISALSEQSSKWAMRSKHVSTLLFMAFMLHLLVMFCDFYIKKWQSVILWSVNAFFVTLLFIDETVNVLFDNYTFSDGLLAVQVRFRLLPMGNVYMAYLAFITVMLLYVGVIVSHNKRRDSVIAVIAFSTALPYVAYMLNWAGVTGGFDCSPTLMMFSCWLTYHFNKRYHFLDDGQIAQEAILDELGEGYIILDSERTVKSYNTIAAMLYPELEQPGESEVVVELIYLHNHDMLEHNGKICNVVVSELREGGVLTGYVMWLYDCTDEYYYMRNLEQLQAHASASDKTMDLFLHHMTYGFGSPLHIIKNRSDAICQDERASDDVREMSLEVLEAGQKLEDMVSVMMEYSKEEPSSATKESEYMTADLVQSLRQMIEERRQGRCRNIELTVSPKLPLNWYGDRDGVERVVSGILHCVGMTSRITGIHLEISSEMRYVDTLLLLTLYLEDNGTMTGEWNRMEAVSNKTETEVNYIPYSLCKRLLIEMQGSVECSVDKKRSKISLMFPQRVIDHAPFEKADGEAVKGDVQPEITSETKAQPESCPTVMVVDDNLLYLREMDAWLRRQELKTIMTKSGAECLRILERKHVDMIFMDQMMPEMDGMQVLSEIRRMEREQGADKPVPVILLTADDTPGARRRYIDVGFDDCLLKPIEPWQIQNQVEHYLHI